MFFPSITFGFVDPNFPGLFFGFMYPALLLLSVPTVLWGLRLTLVLEVILLSIVAQLANQMKRSIVVKLKFYSDPPKNIV